MRRCLLSLAIAVASCRTTGAVPGSGPGSAPPARPGGLVDTGRLVPTQEMKPAAGFSLRQRIDARYSGRDVPAIDAILQLHAGELSLVALTPFGTRALVIHQRGTEVTTEAFVDQLPPLDPKDVLRDIHRVLFRGLFVAAPAPADGVHTGSDGGDRIAESWRAGHLDWRTFTPADADPEKPAVRIDFEGTGAIVAPKVRLQNLRLGYQLVIKTFDQQRLAGQ